MKSITTLALLLFFTFSISAQSASEDLLVDSGKFIIINQKGRTAIYNNTIAEDTEKIILQKDIIQSVVVHDDSNSSMKTKKQKDKLEFRTVISTSEKRAFQGGNLNSISTTHVSKTYSILFDNLSSAKLFADKLIRMCD